MSAGRGPLGRIFMLALAALFAAAESSLGAQGIGDAAGREKQKRERRHEAESKPARTFTDEDLEAAKAVGKAVGGEPVVGDERVPASAGANAPGVPGRQPSAPAADQPQDPLERERQERALLQAEWRVRFANAREQLALAEAASWHDVVRTELYGGVPVQMKVKEQFDTAELQRARKALADLEEQFRRTGLPAGWARETP